MERGFSDLTFFMCATGRRKNRRSRSRAAKRTPNTSPSPPKDIQEESCNSLPISLAFLDTDEAAQSMPVAVDFVIADLLETLVCFSPFLF